MKTKTIFLSMLTSLCMFTSCSQDEQYVNLSNQKQLLTRGGETVEEVIEFYYKGNYYKTTCTVINDSIISFEDIDIENLLIELDKKENLITFAYPDGTVEYFDDSNSFNAEKSRVFALSEEKEKWEVSIPKFSPRNVLDSPNVGPNREYIANLFLHDDTNYEDTMREFDLKKGQGKIEIPHLKPYGMNDKTTSFCAITMQDTKNLFELFEDDTYRSHCFAFLVTMGTNVGMNQGEMALHEAHGLFCCPNLKNIHVKGTKYSSWSDRITSIRITQQ